LYQKVGSIVRLRPFRVHPYVSIDKTMADQQEPSSSNYKKEYKALEGEKRAALKKAKGTKGKKAKDEMAL
jgi:hypothetical protein